MRTETRSHKIRLDPTVTQETYFKKACGTSRFTWNWALEHWIAQYKAGKRPTGMSLKKEFNAIKPVEYPWMYEVTKYASQQPFIFLHNAFQRFYKRLAKFPKYKQKWVHDRFYIGNDHIKVVNKRIRIPHLGWVRMREALRFSGKVISATVSRTTPDGTPSVR